MAKSNVEQILKDVKALLDEIFAWIKEIFAAFPQQDAE